MQKKHSKKDVLYSLSRRLLAVAVAAGLVFGTAAAQAGDAQTQPEAEELAVDLVTGESYQPLSAVERALLTAVISDPDSKDVLPASLIARAKTEYENTLYGKYYQELIDTGYAGENVLRDRAVWLYAFDNFTGKRENGETYTLSGLGILRENVLSGEGLTVYELENGQKLWLPFFSERMMQCFNGMLAWFKENGGENIEAFFAENGLRVILPVVYKPGEADITALVFPECGLVNLNIDEASANNLGDNDLGNLILAALPSEVMGIAYGNFMSLSGDIDYSCEEMAAVKYLLAGYNAYYLYEKAGNDVYKGYSDSVVGLAAGGASGGRDLTGEPRLWHQIDLLCHNAVPLGADTWNFLDQWRNAKLGK
ncbi:MAG: hypothetical protein JW811_04265 [Clostridiales bacterium]|nr:hypothetical protein [Clostridiales bacterium]